MAGVARPQWNAVANPADDQSDDARREIGIADLHVVVAAGGEDVRGLRLEPDERVLGQRPRVKQSLGKVLGTLGRS